MKKILRKDLPKAKAGTEVQIKSFWIDSSNCITTIDGRVLAWIEKNDIPEWVEEVKEKKTIYDLKEGDEFWYLSSDNTISKGIFKNRFNLSNLNFFLTEREAKRNKLLRELATRTGKWLPRKGENYVTYNDDMGYCESCWDGKSVDIAQYNLGLVFESVQEYNKWMTEEAKDLLFNI